LKRALLLFQCELLPPDLKELFVIGRDQGQLNRSPSRRPPHLRDGKPLATYSTPPDL